MLFSLGNTGFLEKLGLVVAISRLLSKYRTWDGKDSHMPSNRHNGDSLQVADPLSLVLQNVNFAELVGNPTDTHTRA